MSQSVEQCMTVDLSPLILANVVAIRKEHILLHTPVYVTPIVGVCNCSMFCCTLLYIHSSIAIILMGKRELDALLNLSSWCLVMVERLFLAVPQGCLRFVIVVFPDHTHLLFLNKTPRLSSARMFVGFYRLLLIHCINVPMTKPTYPAFSAWLNTGSV